MTTLADYWDQRARDFASRGAGLRAVCSYGMPSFYNGYIHLTQQLALKKHLRVAKGTNVLDIGCGIGRWSRQLARRGANVVGVDVAQAMIDEARKRTARDNVSGRTEYRVADLRELDLGRTFEMVLAVTVLQHILDDADLARACANITRHLAPGGRAVLLEAAPSRLDTSCDTHVFRARTAGQYLAAFRAAGLNVVKITGVDPAPFKQKVLPRYRTLAPVAAKSAMFVATALSLPYDAILGRSLPEHSWHKVFVLERDG
ncbi:MAG TPA: class I SAM-dependent methyltransferase [Thermoanaerobaculia bacterium]